MTTKFALVLMTLTLTVLVESVKALVKRVHMIPLNARFMARKIYVYGMSVCPSDHTLVLEILGSPTALIAYSSSLPASCSLKLSVRESAVAHVEVRVVVVSLAKTPLRAAQAPLAMA